MQRPEFYSCENGPKGPLPFDAAEYEARLEGLRDLMALHGLDACLLSSMYNIAYYSEFLHCAFGRPYGLAHVAQKWEPVLSFSNMRNQ